MTPPEKQRGPRWRESYLSAQASYLKAGFAPWLAQKEAETSADRMLRAMGPLFIDEEPPIFLDAVETNWDRDVRALIRALMGNSSHAVNSGLRTIIEAADIIEAERAKRRERSYLEFVKPPT